MSPHRLNDIIRLGMAWQNTLPEFVDNFDDAKKVLGSSFPSELDRSDFRKVLGLVHGLRDHRQSAGRELREVPAH